MYPDSLILPVWWNGRRACLKIRYPQGCGGSSPSTGTNNTVIAIEIASVCRGYLAVGCAYHALEFERIDRIFRRRQGLGEPVTLPVFDVHAAEEQRFFRRFY